MKGGEVEGGSAVQLDARIIESSDVTVAYTNERLLTRLLHQYPDLRTSDRILLIEEGQLPQLVDAVNDILDRNQIERPT